MPMANGLQSGLHFVPASSFHMSDMYPYYPFATAKLFTIFEEILGEGIAFKT